MPLYENMINKTVISFKTFGEQKTLLKNNVTEKNTWKKIIIFVSIFLQIIGITSSSFYVLHINLDTCDVCGSLIVAMGANIENKLNDIVEEQAHDSVTFDSNADTYSHIESDAVNDKNILTYSSIKTSGETSLRDETEDTVEDNKLFEFIIENHIWIYVGLWTVRLCTANKTICTDIGLSESSAMFNHVHPLKEVTENVKFCRPFLVLAVLIFAMLLVFQLFGPSSVLITSYGWTISAFLSTAAVVIAGIPYLNGVIPSTFITANVPWALFCVAISGCLVLLTSLLSG